MRLCTTETSPFPCFLFNWKRFTTLLLVTIVWPLCILNLIANLTSNIVKFHNCRRWRTNFFMCFSSIFFVFLLLSFVSLNLMHVWSLCICKPLSYTSGDSPNVCIKYSNSNLFMQFFFYYGGIRTQNHCRGNSDFATVLSSKEHVAA